MTLRSKIPISIQYTSPRFKLSSVSLYGEPVLSYSPILRNVHRITQNDLHTLKVKSTHIHTICIPEAKLFIRFAPISRFWVHQMTPNNLDMLKVKSTQYACYIHPWGLNFRPFILCWAVFDLSFVWKSTPNDPKWHVQGQKYQYAYNIHPRGPTFRQFRSTMSHFWVTAQCCEKCTALPQMTLTCLRSKVLNIHVTYTHEA